MNTGGDADVVITTVARLLADGTRTTMCTLLLDGRPRSAGELARGAGVAASTASEHLRRLVAGGLVEVTPRGRHRYFRLSNDDVAGVIRALAGFGRPA